MVCINLDKFGQEISNVAVESLEEQKDKKLSWFEGGCSEQLAEIALLIMFRVTARAEGTNTRGDK